MLLLILLDWNMDRYEPVIDRWLAIQGRIVCAVVT